jgi:hypothetical protein
MTQGKTEHWSTRIDFGKIICLLISLFGLIFVFGSIYVAVIYDLKGAGCGLCVALIPFGIGLIAAGLVIRNWSSD